jgi:hypothetical protein
MGLREISRTDFVRISEQRNSEPPANATEAGWVACDGNDLVAALFYQQDKAEWQAVVYQCGEVAAPTVAAVLAGFKTRAEAEFAVGSKMQCLILAAEVADRQRTQLPSGVETA